MGITGGKWESLLRQKNVSDEKFRLKTWRYSGIFFLIFRLLVCINMAPEMIELKQEFA